MIGWAVETLVGVSLVLLLVLAMRRPVAHAFGAEWAYALWLLPLARIVSPSLPRIGGDIPSVLPPVTIIIPATGEAAASLPPDGGTGQWLPLMLALWAGGAAIFVLWQQSTYGAFLLHLGRDNRPGRPDRHGGVRVVESEAVEGPVAIGLLRRRIVVPLDFATRYTPAEQRLALDHELIHHRRFDLWTNLVALAWLTLNWFNPIAHAAFRAFRADQELACDAAIARRAPGQRHDYACALVKSASQPGLIAACPLSHASTLKRRLKMMKQHRGSWLRTAGGAAALTAIGVAGLALSTPGFAQRDGNVGEVVTQALAKEGKIITPAEEARIREKCGDTASGRQGISLHSHDGVLVCDNGKVVNDPETRAIVGRITDRANRKVKAVMNDPKVVAAIDGEATRAAEAALGKIDEADIADAMAKARTHIDAVDMSDAREAMARAKASLAAIDLDKIAAISMPAVRVRLSAEDRADIEKSIAEARAQMAAVHIDRAEIDRAMEEARADLREAEQERREALREAQRERAEAIREAQRERAQALREAEMERRQALREAEEARREAQGD